jgi:spermidine/putrescine transport system substrate-binding protein
VFTWSIYCPSAVVAAFEAATPVKVNCSYYDSLDQMFAKLKAGGGRGVDVIQPTNNVVQQMISAGQLQPLDLTRIPNYNDLLDSYKGQPWAQSNGFVYAVAYDTGIEGICYRTDLITDPVTSWGAVFDPRYAGHIGVSGTDPTAFIGTALWKGIDPETLNVGTDAKLAVLTAAIVAQTALKPIYYSSTDDKISSLTSGETWIATADDGECRQMKLAGAPVRFVFPTEGAWIWADTLAIARGAPNEAAAYAWINHLLSPQMGAVFMQAEGLIMVNPKAVALLPANVAPSYTIDPSAKVVGTPNWSAALNAKLTQAYLQARGG